MLHVHYRGALTEQGRHFSCQPRKSRLRVAAVGTLGHRMEAASSPFPRSCFWMLPGGSIAPQGQTVGILFPHLSALTTLWRRPSSPCRLFGAISRSPKVGVWDLAARASRGALQGFPRTNASTILRHSGTQRRDHLGNEASCRLRTMLEAISVTNKGGKQEVCTVCTTSSAWSFPCNSAFS